MSSLPRVCATALEDSLRSARQRLGSKMEQPKHTPRLKARRTQMQAPASPVPTWSASPPVVEPRGARMKRTWLRVASNIRLDQQAEGMSVPSVQPPIKSEEYGFTSFAALPATGQPAWRGWLGYVPCSSPLAASAARPNPSVKLSPNGGPRGPGRRYAVHFRQPGPRIPPLVPAYLQR